MSEKNTKATENVEIDPGMSVMPEEPGLMDVPTVIPELDSVLAAMPTALPAYQTTVWKNKPSTETPVDAAVMTRVEQRLVDLTNAVNALRDSVSQLPVKGFQNKECSGDDFDQLKEFFGSIYQRTPWTSGQHGPVGFNEYGFLFAFGSPAHDVFIQIYFSNYGQGAYRSKYIGSAWKEWKSFA